MFETDPYERSSTPATSSPSASNSSQTCDPMNPAAPVTPTFFISCLLGMIRRFPASSWSRSRIPGTTRSVTPVTACPLTISG